MWCQLQQTHMGNQRWMASTRALNDLLLSHEDRIIQLESILKRCAAYKEDYSVYHLLRQSFCCIIAHKCEMFTVLFVMV